MSNKSHRDTCKRGQGIVASFCYFALLEFMEAVQIDIFFLLTSAVVSPLY